MRVSLFAVEDTAVQVCWAGAAPGPLILSAGPTTTTVQSDGGPGAVRLAGLPPGTDLDLIVGEGGRRSRRVERFRTLMPPPGRLLCRFATINDLHIGATRFGTLRPIMDDGRSVPHPVRCARAAIAEAGEWGAELLVAKGDLTQEGAPDEWEALACLLAGAQMPSLVMEGNHDVKPQAVDGSRILARAGISLHMRPTAVDLPGIRIVVMPTAQWHVRSGQIIDRHAQAVVQMVSDAPGPAVVVLHHYPQRFRYPTMLPAGIPGPEAAPFLDALAEANPATLVLCGHSHRHRRHAHGPLVVAEVGSTKDFPGSWAGYAVHERGIRQTTMRVSAPDAIRWTEQGRGVLGGIWGLWAPGVRSHRCFTHLWPPRPD
jgi:Icc protein